MTTTDNSQSTANKPTLTAYQIREGEGKSYWTRIGAAWAHKDGKGFNLQVDVIPLDGKITLRVESEKKEQ